MSGSPISPVCPALANNQNTEIHMKRLGDILNQPSSFEYDLKSIFKESAGIGLFIFLFLTIFKPFETEGITESITVTLAVNFGYGLITFLAVFIYNALIPKLLPKLFFQDRIKLKHVILYISGLLILIGLGNAFYHHALYPVNSLFKDVIDFQFCTTAIGLFPVVYLFMMGQYWSLKKNIRNAQAINQDLGNAQKQKTGIPFPEQSLTLTSENRKETLQIPSSRLLFIKSAGNYIEVFTHENNRVKKHLLRNTIKRIDHHLARNAFIMRCHRAYLMNLLNIQKVSGDSQGYRVTVRDTNLQVPVSRSYLKQFKRSIRQMTIK
jgi:hypothetical protein